MNVIRQLRVAIKEERRGKLATGVLFCVIILLCTSPELHKRLFVSASSNSIFSFLQYFPPVVSEAPPVKA